MLERDVRGLETIDGDTGADELSVELGRDLLQRSLRAKQHAQAAGDLLYFAQRAVAVDRAERLARIVAGDRDGAVVAGLELAHGALGDDTAAIDDRHVVADLLDLVQQVRGEDERPPLGDPGAD